MEPILFYGVPQGCSFGSIVALEWLGEPYRLCRIEMDDIGGDLFVQANPLRETPVLLLEDGVRLNQSAAILQHFAARTPSHPMGLASDGPRRDRVNQALGFLTTSYFSAFSPLWAAFEMAADPPVQEMLRAQGRRKVAKVHAQLESLLKGQDWLAGDQRTVADAYFIGIVRWNTFHQVLDLENFPRIADLAARLDSDPSVEFARDIEDGRPAKSAGGFKGHVLLRDLAPRLAA
jgi:glutathione S-transferase